jgi:hypothetical protein
MSQEKYPKPYIDERGVKDPTFLDALRNAADLYHFVHTDGLYKGDRVFRAAEVQSFFNVLKHPCIVPTIGTASQLKDDKWWRRKLIWLASNSATLSQTERPRGSVGEMLLAYLLHDRELVFRHRGMEGTDVSYLAISLLPPPPPPPTRLLISLYGSGIMCVQSPLRKRLEQDARRYASEIFPGVATWRWGVTKIVNRYVYQ